MKIGNREFKAKINNRVIFDIEEVFGNKNIGIILAEIQTLTTKDMAMLIHQTIKEEISFDEFADEIQLNQYTEAATEVGLAISKAFGLDSKKK